MISKPMEDYRKYPPESLTVIKHYFMCVGNHIPWNVPPEAVKRYLDLCRDRAHR